MTKPLSVFSRILMPTALALATLTIGRAEVSEQDMEIVDRMERVFVQVAEKAFPATVVITSSREITPSRQMPKEMEDLFEQFFRWHNLPGPGTPPSQPRQPRSRPLESLGSGFFISPDGYILTNSHVIEGADEILVRMQDGREAIAEVVGTDPPSDIALIKVDLKDVTYFELGDSDQVKIGQWALAVGAPLHFDYTFTRGIVSAKGRTLPLPAARVQYTEQEYIQVDALINPGNSGGPLLNTRGEVIGINTLISGQYGYYGFAVPINIAKRVADSIKKNGRMVRPWIGIVMQELSQDEKNYHGVESGVFVFNISEDSPAKTHGLERGDVILSLDGQPTNTPIDLKKLVLARQPGDQVEIEFLHKGERKKATITLTEVPDSLTQIAGSSTPRNSVRGQATVEKWGLTVDALSEEIRTQLELEEDHGLIITEVKSKSPADRAGLSAGDVVLEIDYNKVTDVDDLTRLLEESNPDKGALFYLYRRGEYGFRLVKPTE